MPTFDVTIAGKTFAIDAPSADALPEIVDQIASQMSAGTTATQMAEQPSNMLQTPMEGGPVQAPQTEGPSALDYMAPTIRGAGPVAGGALLGAAIGAPLAGVGAPIGAAAGAAAVGLSELVGDPLVAGINQVFGTRLSTPTEGWQYLFDKMGIPQSTEEGQKLIEAIARGGASALTGIGAGKLLQQSTNATAQAIGTALAEEPTRQVISGAAGGFGAEAGQDLAQAVGAGEFGQAAAGLAGGLAGGAVGSFLGAPRGRTSRIQVPGMTPQEVEQVVQEAEQAGRTIMTSDVIQPRTALGKRLQELMENVPFLGTAKLRAQMQEQRLAAINEFFAQYGLTGAPDEFTNALGQTMDALKKFRQNSLSSASTAKQGVLDRLSAGPIVRSADIDNTLRTIISEINTLKATNKEHYAPLIDNLQSMGRALLGTPSVATRTFSGKTLHQIENNLRILSEDMVFNPTLAHVKTDAEKVTGRIRQALKDDIHGFIQANGTPADLATYQSANRRISTMLGELGNATLKRALKTGDVTPEIVQRMLLSKNPSDVKLLMRNLSASEKQTARVALLAKTLQDSLSRESGDISARRLLTQLQKNELTRGIVFTPAELQATEGLQKYLQLTTRAGDFDLNAPTGMRNTVPLMLGGLFSLSKNIPRAVALFATIGNVARLYESKTVRNLLMNFNKFTPGTPEQLAAFKQLHRAIQTELGNYYSEKWRNKRITFAPENTTNEPFEHPGFPRAFSRTDNATGFRMIKSRLKIGLYDKQNQLVGMYNTVEDAQKAADKAYLKTLKSN